MRTLRSRVVRSVGSPAPTRWRVTDRLSLALGAAVGAAQQNRVVRRHVVEVHAVHRHHAARASRVCVDCARSQWQRWQVARRSPLRCTLTTALAPAIVPSLAPGLAPGLR